MNWYLTLETILTFGKYEGKQVEDLLDDDPGYLFWLAENTPTIFNDEAYEALNKRRQYR